MGLAAPAAQIPAPLYTSVPMCGSSPHPRLVGTTGHSPARGTADCRTGGLSRGSALFVFI